jgi:hypothetical protein
MTILWSILKIIGLILLWALLVMLVVICWLLFLPFHYQLKGVSPEGGPVEGSVRIQSFLCFWQATLEKQQEEYGFFVYAFWGKLQVYPWKWHPGKKDKKVQNTERGEPDTSALTEEEVEEILSEKEPGTFHEEKPAEKTAERTESKQKTASENKAHASPGETATKKKRNRKTHSKVSKKESWIDKWKKIHKNINNEHNKKAVNFLLQKGLWLLGKIKPKVLHADMEFSLGDPALTGMATGILSLCPACYGKHTQIYPDFASEKIYAYGWIEIKGIVFLIHIVYLIISIFFNQDCKKLLQQ